MVECFLPLLHEGPYVFLGDKGERSFASHRMTGDNPDALAEVQDVRRSIETDLKSGGCEGRSQHVGDRSLAVGTGHMDDLIAPVRMPHQLVRKLHIRHSRLVGSGSHLLKGGKAHKELLNHLLIPFF